MTVKDILSMTVDLQKIAITYSKGYEMEKFVYFGTANNMPQHYFNKRVSKFYSDYSPLDGSFLGVVIID